MSFRDYFWSKGEPWNSVRSWIVPRLLRATHSALMSTLRISVSGGAQLPPFLDAPDCEMGALLVTWHDLTLLPLHLLRDKNIGVMTSRSRAGQMQAAFWRLYGWPTVWGSSTRPREGVQALREALRLLREGQSFAFTPDGPKGPRHRVQPGVVYLASKAPTVVIPLGVAADRAWRLSTWDRYFIPQPWSRVHIHLGAPLSIPPNLSKDEMAHWQERIENAINETLEKCQREVANRRTVTA